MTERHKGRDKSKARKSNNGEKEQAGWCEIRLFNSIMDNEHQQLFDEVSSSLCSSIADH